MTCTEWTTTFVPHPTNKLTNLYARQLVNLSTHLRANSLSYQPVNSKYCQLFSVNFNIMSTLSTHQPPTLSQKIDSREGLF